MSEWPQVPLRDVTTHIKDGTHGTHRRVESGVPLLSAKNIGANGRLSWDKTDDQISEADYSAITASFAPKKGDLLLTIVGTIGRSAVFNGSRVAFQRSVAFVRPDEPLLSEYLFQSSCSADFARQLQRRCNVTAQGGLYLGELAKVTIPLPSRVRQREIATILTSIDTAIEKTEALIEKYQQIKAGLMHDLFTRGVLPNGQLRPPREQAPELYQETAIGWIPKTWTLKELSEIAEVIDPQPDHRTPPEDSEGIPYIGIGDFDEFGYVEFGVCRKITSSAFRNQQARFTVSAGDVIYGKIGTIGQPRWLPNGRYAVSANVILLQPRIGREYFYCAVSSLAFRMQVTRITNTTSQPALGIETMRRLLLPVPLETEATFIGDTIGSLASKEVVGRRQLQKLKLQKLGLMQDLLTGKVAVKVSHGGTALG